MWISWFVLMQTNGKIMTVKMTLPQSGRRNPSLSAPSACRTAASQESDVECKQAIEVK